MDVLFIVVMFVVVSIIDNLSKRKRPRVPPPQNRDEQPSFDIPTLANDPNLPGEEIPILIETPRPAEVRPINPPPRSVQQMFTQPQRSQKISAQPVHETQEVSGLDVEFTPSTIVNGFIISELLDKPKALRRRGRRL